jgi:hypothetical protein
VPEPLLEGRPSSLTIAWIGFLRGRRANARTDHFFRTAIGFARRLSQDDRNIVRWRQLPLLRLRNTLWKGLHSLAGGGCSEVVDRAIFPVAVPIALHRSHGVVVGGVRA